MQRLEYVDLLTAENLNQLYSGPYRCRDIASGAVPAAMRCNYTTKFKATDPTEALFRLRVEEAGGMVFVELEMMHGDIYKLIEMLERILADFPGKRTNLHVTTLSYWDVGLVPRLCALPGMKSLSVDKIDGCTVSPPIQVQPHDIETVFLRAIRPNELTSVLFAAIIRNGRALEDFNHAGDIPHSEKIALAVQQCPTLRRLGNNIDRESAPLLFDNASWMVDAALTMTNIRSLKLDTSNFDRFALLNLSYSLSRLTQPLDLSIKYDSADDHSAAAFVRNLQGLQLKSFDFKTYRCIPGSERHLACLLLLRHCKSLVSFSPAIDDDGLGWLTAEVVNEIVKEGREMHVGFDGQWDADVEKMYNDPTPIQRYVMIAGQQNRRLGYWGPSPKGYVGLLSMTEEEISFKRKIRASLSSGLYAPAFVGLTVERILAVLNGDPLTNDFAVYKTDLSESFALLISGIATIRRGVRRLEFSHCNIEY